MRILILEGILKEYNNKTYIDDKKYLVSYINDRGGTYIVYCFQDLPYNKEQIFEVYHKINDNLFSKKTRIFKKFFLEKLPLFKMPVALNNEIVNFISNNKGYVYQKNFKDFMFDLRSTTPHDKIGEAHFITQLGSQLLGKYSEAHPNYKGKIDPQQVYLTGFINVDSVYVDPQYRNQGIAKAMYMFAEKVFGYKIIPVSTLKSGAIGLHKSLGNL